MIGDPHVRHRARSAARSPTTTRRPTIRRRCWRLAPPSSPTSAKIAADKFFKGLFETALKDGEIVTAVKFTAPAKAGYEKFPNPASRYAIVGVFVAKGKRRARCGDGRWRRWRVPRQGA
jgi:carbon-monoxide dehydrogenase medium subunit